VTNYTENRKKLTIYVTWLNYIANTPFIQKLYICNKTNVIHFQNVEMCLKKSTTILLLGKQTTFT